MQNRQVLSDLELAAEAFKNFYPNAQSVGRFRAISERLGFPVDLQLSLLDCTCRKDAEKLFDNADSKLPARARFKLEVFGKCYTRLMELTRSEDRVISIIFNPIGEAPFFGQPPIRMFERSNLNTLYQVASYFESDHFAASIRNDGVLTVHPVAVLNEYRGAERRAPTSSTPETINCPAEECHPDAEHQLELAHWN